MRRKQVIRCLSALGLALSALLLPGCWDRKEINDVAFVLSSAFDIDENGQYRYTVMLPLPGQMGGPTGGGGGTGGQKSYYIDSETGKTFREAVAKLQKRMSRQIFLAHRRTIVIGEDLAKRGISELFDFVVRSPENRMSTFMIVTKGKASDLLNAHPQFERFPAEDIRELAKSQSVMYVNEKDIALALSNVGSDPIMVYMDAKKSQMSKDPTEEIQVEGYAQFKRDRMVGLFESDTAQGLAWLRNQLSPYDMTIKLSEGKFATVRIYQGKSSIELKLRNGRLHYLVKAKANARLLEAQETIDFNKITSSRLVENQLSASIRKVMEKAVRQMQDKGTDSAALGQVLFRRFPVAWKKDFAPRWPEALKQAEFDYDIRSDLTETGLILENVVKGAGSR